MTYKELYNLAKNKLNDSVEAQILCEDILGFSRHDVIISPNKQISDTSEFINAVEMRLKGRPLQYIIGHWGFAGLDLFVKDGVLVPREDTQILTNCAIDLIGNKALNGVDLCAGTGAVALAIANTCKNVTVTALELYPIPLECLNINTKKYGQNKVNILKADVLTDFDKFKNLDFIVSNPPYINTAEIKTLQIEVQNEPITALDGGQDGLDFYKSIIENWTGCLKPNGFMAFEIGETQGQAVKALMKLKGYTDIRILKDFNMLDRVVVGKYL